MKGSTKAQFSGRLGGVLTKLKDSSTVQVAHEQARVLFAEYPLRDIFVAFVSKMDTVEQASEREKREMARLYVAFVDAYKAQLLAEQYYEKLLESLSKKTTGVSEVIAHICKNLLSRIQDYDHLLPLASAVLVVFHAHHELARILKQLAETVNPSVIGAMQGEMMSLIVEKANAAKAKGEYLDAVLALVMCLQDRLEVESQVVGLMLKYLRHEEWSCRKNCVDIAYALLVINRRIAEPVHAAIRELKYDKIKHVRDSVNNYDKLHEQIFGKETPQKPQPQPSIREAKIKSDYSNKKMTRSPAPLPKEEEKDREEQRERPSSSLDKSAKPKMKNENFFKNAKNSDVIRITQTTTPELKREEEDQPSFTQSMYLPKEESVLGKNFEAYLKDRTSPRQKDALLPVFERPAERPSEVKKALSKFETLKSDQKVKFNYESELEQFKKKQKPAEVDPREERISISFAEEPIPKNEPEFSLSYISQKQDKGLLEDFRTLLLGFEKRINERLDRMEVRLDNLERTTGSGNSSGLMERERTFEALGVSQLQESPRSILYNSTPFDSKYSYTDREGVESNLDEKIRLSIAAQNWDEAFTIALTNGRKNVLLNLLERGALPVDGTVEECILLEARKLLGHVSALKWLRQYLLQREVGAERLGKLRDDLRRRPPTDNRNYEMLKQMLLNDIHDKLAAQK